MSSVPNQTPAPLEAEAREITALLHAWSGGDAAAENELVPLIYGELRRIAQRQMRCERPDHTLQATAIVHEAYLRLRDQRGAQWPDRARFFAFAAHLIRRILVDHARVHNRSKRGGGWRKVTLAEAADLAPQSSPDLVALDDALSALAKRDPRKAAIVELRFFGGLTLDETASCLGLSPDVVWREWQRAKAWLLDDLHTGQSG